MRFHSSFFQYINFVFGQNTVLLFKSWIGFNKSIIESRLKTEFLRKCIKFNIIPPHVSNVRFNANFFSHKSANDFKHWRLLFSKQLLQIEFSDTYLYIRAAYTQIYKLSRLLYRDIPLSICNSFFIRQQGPLHSFFINQHDKLNKKFDNLLTKHRVKINDIKQIHYFYSSPTHSHTSARERRFYFKPLINLKNAQNRDLEIVIDPHSFKEKEQHSFLHINEKWFVNCPPPPYLETCSVFYSWVTILVFLLITMKN